MGPQHDPWFIEASPFDPTAYGAYPAYEFDHQQRPLPAGKVKTFEAPSLTLPEGFTPAPPRGAADAARGIDRQRVGARWRWSGTASFDDHRQGAVSLLTDRKVRQAFDVARRRAQAARPLRPARLRLVAPDGPPAGRGGRQPGAGEPGQQRDLGHHGNIFPHLKDKLFPPTDQAVSALLDDLIESGLLDSTLIVMAGEFGRTPRISRLPQYYKLPGRDHWGKVQTVFFAGGGVQGGRVVGSSDKIGGFPRSDPQTPENMAATIYHALGLPPTDRLARRPGSAALRLPRRSDRGACPESSPTETA